MDDQRGPWAEVPGDNAFAMSFLASGARPTPFTFDVRRSEDGRITILDLVAWKARDAVNVLGSPDDAVMLVTGVDHYEFIDNAGTTNDLASIVGRLGLEAMSFDVEWSKPVSGGPGRRDVFLSVHDDKFLRLEARRDAPIWNVLTCCLQLFIAEALRGVGADAPRVQPPHEIVEALGSMGRTWTLGRDRVALSGETVSLGFAAQGWKSGEPVQPTSDALIVWETSHGTWRFA
jgi:hypothetical protein